MRTKKLVLFDWDGTLLNNFPVLYQSCKRIFESQGKVPPTPDEYFSRIDTFRSFYGDSGINLSREELDALFIAHYKELAEDSELSPTAETALAMLYMQGMQNPSQEIILGLITGMDESAVRPLLRKFRLLHFFRHTYFGAQDKSEIMIELLQKEKVAGENCYYIGDHPHDIRHSLKAGVKAIAYMNGYIPPEMIYSEQPHYIIYKIQHVVDIIT